MDSYLRIDQLDFNYENNKYRLTALPDLEQENVYQLTILKFSSDETYCSKVNYSTLKQMQPKFGVYDDMQDLVKTLKARIDEKNLKVIVTDQYCELSFEECIRKEDITLTIQLEKTKKVVTIENLGDVLRDMNIFIHNIDQKVGTFEINLNNLTDKVNKLTDKVENHNIQLSKLADDQKKKFNEEIIEITTSIKEQTLTGHTSAVYCVIKLNESKIASCSYDESIKIWDLSAEKCTYTLNGHTNVVYCLLKLDDNTIASCSWDNSIKIWDLLNQSCTKTLNGHTLYVNCLILIGDNTIAAI